MDKKFSSLLEKKKKSGEGLSDVEKHAKFTVLKDLQSQASKAMGSKLQAFKNAPTPVAEHNEALESPVEEAHETPEEEASEYEAGPGMEEAAHEPEMKPIEHMSEDEVDHHLQKLMAHKAKLKGNK